MSRARRRNARHDPRGLRLRVARRHCCRRRAHLVEYVLLLDEPFKGLDEETKACVIERTRALSAGKTVVLVTHDEREAKAMGAGVIEL